MADDNDQDQELALSAFGRAAVKGAVGQARSAVKGAGLAANAVSRIIPSTPPGGDNTNFPSPTGGTTD